jgi:hypothetical protein
MSGKALEKYEKVDLTVAPTSAYRGPGGLQLREQNHGLCYASMAPTSALRPMHTDKSIRSAEVF